MNNILQKLEKMTIFNWECIMLGFATFLLPFHTGHKFLVVPFMGNMGPKLSIYPLLIGLGLFIYNRLKTGTWNVPRYILYFFSTLLVWHMFSLVHGYHYFPAWQEISSDKFKTLQLLVSLFAKKGIYVDSLLIGRVWWSVKLVIVHILEYGVTYGTSLWIISLFYQNAKATFHFFSYGILASSVICVVYSVIEFLYLFGCFDAMKALAVINPFIYDVGIDHGWWPPLLEKTRIRSIFAEPAFLSLYLSISIPVLFLQIHKSLYHKWIWKIMFVMQIFMMWGTNSKTAMGIMLAEGLAACFFLILRRKRLQFKQIYSSIIILLFLSTIGIGLNHIFQHRYAIDYNLVSINPDETITLNVTNRSKTYWDKRKGIALTGALFTNDWKRECGRIVVPLGKSLFPGQSCQVHLKFPQYISKIDYPNIAIELETKNSWEQERRLGEEGAGSFTLYWDGRRWLGKGEVNPKENKMTALTSKTEGSNQQRYGLMYVETLIGLDHFLLGVGGQDLKQAYFIHYIPDWLMENGEIKLWVSYQKEKGLLKAYFPILSDYTHQFSSYGLLGLILYLTPSFYGFYLLIKTRKLWLGFASYLYLKLSALITGFFGMMVSFVGCNSYELYIYWIVLGVLLGCLETIDKSKSVDIETE